MEQLTLGRTDPGMSYRHRWTVGVDLGQSHDPTAICVVERIDGEIKGSGYMTAPGYGQRTDGLDPPSKFRPRYHVRALERLPLNASYPEQVAYVLAMLRREPLNDAGVFVDYTGVGRPVFDMFRQARVPRLHGVTITAGRESERNAAGWSVPKVELIGAVQAKLHSGDLKIAKELPDAPALLRELQDFRVRFTSVGNATFGAREGAHDDLVLALALAIFGAAQDSRVTVAPLRL